MKNAVLFTAVASLLMLVAGFSAHAADSKTLTGEYFWKQADENFPDQNLSRGPLEAIFEPKGEGTWAVSFHFEFQGEKHIYTGTAEGSLTDGALTGEVVTDDQRSTFTFEGAFEDGRFTGTHASMREGTTKDLGTLTLG